MQKGLSCAAKSTKSTPPEKIGPVVKDSCAPFPYASFEAEYRARNGVPAEALVELVRASAPDMLISDKQETGCVIARDVVVREESQCGSRVGSEEVRACCSAAGGDCRYQQSEPSNRGVELHNPSANTSPAISRAVSLVQAVFPGAEHRKECLGGEAYCLQVDAKPPGNGERARLSASINVPMSLLGFVGSEVIKVSFEAAREGELSRVRRFD
jgi:hypothetical protein